MNGRILHTGALLALADGSLYMGALLRLAVDADITLAVPTGALAAAWARARGGRYRISAALSLNVVVTVPMSEPAAITIGALLADAATDDVVAGHTVALALDQDWVIINNDATPLRRVSDRVAVDELP